MPYRLQSGSPEMTIADVSARCWITIIGCSEGHSVRLDGDELSERFPAAATLGQIAERLKCSECGSTSGLIGFIQDNSPTAQARLMRKDGR